MNVFENEILNLKKSATFLLYADNRISLLDKAKEFANLLMVENSNDILNHPDVSYYSDIKISDVRDIIISSVESPYISNKKIYIINSIENSKKEPLNALLKVIEEPPKNVYFILLTRRLEILETIKSRSIILNLNLSINTDIVKNNLSVFDFYENNLDYLNLYLDNVDKIDINIYEIEEIDEIFSSIKNIFDDKNIYTITAYQCAIRYLIENIKFMKKLDVLMVKERLMSILLVNNDNKKSRERIKMFMNTCINKYSKLKNARYLDKLIEYKLAIDNNVNIKLLMFLFIHTLSKI
ncbi:hypothetical protein HP397_01115 [Streptobacillus felis]|uniref:DNA polymerase III subunit delta n=1 Tax=Streptobacillus felis TaxID=1384509 RepID=A0A7Z0T9Y9_9FUSO|nr:hypothetical protein [Streptobacillus felis]NYV27427.1 hypothetical protein [Streptobacillus felis]